MIYSMNFLLKIEMVKILEVKSIILVINAFL